MACPIPQGGYKNQETKIYFTIPTIKLLRTYRHCVACQYVDTSTCMHQSNCTQHQNNAHATKLTVALSHTTAKTQPQLTHLLPALTLHINFKTYIFHCRTRHCATFVQHHFPTACHQAPFNTFSPQLQSYPETQASFYFLAFLGWQFAIGGNNKVTPYSARLVMRWVGILNWHATSHPGQLSPLPSVARKMRSAKGQWQSCAARKVTVGLALHWLCVTNSVVYPLTGAMV